MEEKARVAPGHVDREQTFIQNCLASELFPDRSLVAAPPDLDWERLYQLLDHHRLAAHFFVLGSNRPDLWLGEFQERLRRDRYKMLLYGERCQEQVREILSALATAGILVIVLKGWALIYILYDGDPSQRFYEDIDLLVLPGKVDAAEGVLGQMGYRGMDETWPGYTRRFCNARAYVYAQQGEPSNSHLGIGLHWGLIHTPVYEPGRVDIGMLFERAQPLQIAGVEVRRLCPEHNLIYSCAHLGLHHYYDEALFRYFEIAASIHRAGGTLDWNDALALAKAWQCIIPFKQVLGRIEALWPGIAPATVMETLASERASFRERFTETWIKASGGREAFMTILNWLALPGLRNRMIRVLQDMFPSRAYMQRRYGSMPDGIWPLLYFRRLYRACRMFINKSDSSPEHYV